MTKEGLWFQSFQQSDTFQFLQKHPIAYFCAEYALSDDLPIFAGGLGILAGDFLREAADQHIPLVAVGLFYYEGYTVQKVGEDGELTEEMQSISPKDTDLIPVVDQDNNRLIVTIEIGESRVSLQAWKKEIGSVTLYLLDSHAEENNETERHITDSLYVADKETRLKQEIVLGIGGMRLLELLEIHPSVYHMNEGHSAMLGFELIRNEMREQKIGFTEAKERARHRIIFTNHTLIAAGNDIFSIELVSLLLKNYAEHDLQVPIIEIIGLGKVKDANYFSMTTCSLRIAGKINAVSKLHAKFAQEIWPDHPMIPITNGIYLPMWDLIGESHSIQSKHWENKKKLIEEVKKMSGNEWDESDLIIGWARRIVQYKRPFAIFEDIDKFLQLTTTSQRTIRVVLSGEAHPSDLIGLDMLRKLRSLIKTKLAAYVVYFPNYNIEKAKILFSGADVWLNTPIVGSEACGTSGMKAALNGTLPVSTKDGWMGEVNLYGIGWEIENTPITENIHHILADKIVPFFSDNQNAEASGWAQNMQSARQLIQNEFSMTKTLKNYIQILYVPIISSLQQN